MATQMTKAGFLQLMSSSADIYRQKYQKKGDRVCVDEFLSRHIPCIEDAVMACRYAAGVYGNGPLEALRAMYHLEVLWRYIQQQDAEAA